MSGRPKPACVACKCFFRPVRNGCYVLEQMPVPSNAKPGTEEEHNWRPYKIWVADKWRCEGCGVEIISGYGHTPVAEHFTTDFDAWRGRVTVVVNDC